MTNEQCSETDPNQMCDECKKGFEEHQAKNLVPINEFKWTDDYSFMRTLTCINHQTARYSTKNPFFRSLICTKLPEGDIERSNTGECTCPMSNLVVVTGNGQ